MIRRLCVERPHMPARRTDFEDGLILDRLHEHIGIEIVEIDRLKRRLECPTPRNRPDRKRVNRAA